MAGSGQARKQSLCKKQAETEPPPNFIVGRNAKLRLHQLFDQLCQWFHSGCLALNQGQPHLHNQRSMATCASCLPMNCLFARMSLQSNDGNKNLSTPIQRWKQNVSSMVALHMPSPVPIAFFVSDLCWSCAAWCGRWQALPATSGIRF